MGIYNIHAGHCPQGQGAYGAVGVLQESVENRLVKNRVISALRSAGHTAYDCTDDTNCDVNTNLARIVAKCNAHAVNLDVSIHLNSGRNDYKGDGSVGGVEVWCYDTGTRDIAQRICNNISAKLGMTNRGVKYSQDLYVLNSTNAPALLVECCFVDDEDDAARWDANVCGDAIASGILKTTVTGVAPAKPQPVTAKVEIRAQTGDDSQRFYTEDAGGGYIRLKNKRTGLYLDAGQAKNDTVLQLSKKSNAGTQLWKLVYKSHGAAQYVLLEPKLAPGRYVSIENNGLDGKVKVKLWDDLKNSKQKFWAKQADDGTYVFVHTYSLKAISAI